MNTTKTNIQITPARTLVIPNDRISKKLFNLTAADIEYWVGQHNTVNFTELLNHKRFGDIISPIKLFVDEESFTISEPIDPFDRAVLAACISEWEAGNRYTTPAIIYRALTGKVGRKDAAPSKNQLADILNSLKVLMRLQIDYDLSLCCKKLGYNNGKPTHVISALLPAYYLQASTVNGKDATVIAFDRESPQNQKQPDSFFRLQSPRRTAPTEHAHEHRRQILRAHTRPRSQAPQAIDADRYFRRRV